MHAELIYKIMNAPVKSWPFPHLEINDFLPRGLYNNCLAHWPTDFQDIAKVRPVGGYKDRKAIHFKGPAAPQAGPWKELHDITTDDHVVAALLAKLKPPPDISSIVSDCLLVEDRAGYSIGPHTDSPAKLISILLYMPWAARADLGTSLYIPSDGFTCPGGPHYDKASHDFQEVKRFDYRPNKLVAFKKTSNSFHGVEPVPPRRERRVFIWNLRTNEVGHG